MDLKPSSSDRSYDLGIAILAGVPSSVAVAWARSVHCDKAVETPEQALFVADFGD